MLDIGVLCGEGMECTYTGLIEGVSEKALLSYILKGHQEWRSKAFTSAAFLGFSRMFPS